MPNHEEILRIPGPTPIPPRVSQAMSQPMIGHRSQRCKDLLKDIAPKLNPIFGTQEDVIVLTGSGTSALEAAVVNTTMPGDEVLVVVTGAFGDRFASICEAYGLTVHRHDVTWGDAVQVEDVSSYLNQYPGIRAVFVTHCETSTAVLNPVKEIANQVHEQSDALVIVDGVSSIGGADLKLERDGIDLLVSGSQKAMMLPAGLSFVAYNHRTWSIIEENTRPRFYLDLRKYRGKLQEGQTPFTPALSLLFGLNEALDLMHEEGLESVYERHHLMKRMARAAFQALGLPLLTTEEAASPTVTSVKPERFDAEQLRKVVHEEAGLLLAGGQQHLKGKIFRIGHMGYCTPADVLQAISIIELGLKQLGQEIELGAGVAAAEKIYTLEKGGK
ncbi:alanine--glyoxylate aminotransferase family protein [Thalassobacillus sp. CUG 92003]|uniref:pyridoxal-phosphate-dependent aminotransferase family protein n=1 Tax=Thalassobacillus sp. CUG 92003 TaxID=2736641 RepID=UPI0015E6C5B1|nr:alanine--glyoxylate aminotransferase family protein [Thalassobacillus sp. CUG 92003]